MAIKLNSDVTYGVQHGKHQEVVLSDSESESKDHQNNDDGEMLPWLENSTVLDIIWKIIELLDCSNNINWIVHRTLNVFCNIIFFKTMIKTGSNDASIWNE